jgi:hypothetical protein
MSACRLIISLSSFPPKTRSIRRILRPFIICYEVIDRSRGSRLFDWKRVSRNTGGNQTTTKVIHRVNTFRILLLINNIIVFTFDRHYYYNRLV